LLLVSCSGKKAICKENDLRFEQFGVHMAIIFFDELRPVLLIHICSVRIWIFHRSSLYR
jgi:hypothetical protein